MSSASDLGSIPLCALLLTLSGGATLRASLVSEPDAVDLGAVHQNEEVPCAFTVRNAGERAVQITRVTRSCGCTTVHIDAKHVAPGATALVQLVVSTALTDGPQESTVTLHTDESGLARERTLRVRYATIPEFRLSAPAIEFGKVALTAPRMHRRVRIEAIADPNADLTVPERPGDLLEAKLAPDPNGVKGAWTLDVTLPANSPQGSIQCVVPVKTSSAFRPEIRLLTTAEVGGPFALAPRAAAFGIVRPDRTEALVRTVEVRRHDGAAFSLDRLVCRHSLFQVRCPTLGRRLTVHEIRTILPAPAQSAPASEGQLVSASVLLFTDGREGPSVVVRVAGMLQAKATSSLCCSDAKESASARE